MASIERFPDQAPQAQGQQGEEARVARPGKRKFLGFWLHEWGAAFGGAISRRSRGARFPEPGTGTDAPDPRQKPRADHQGVCPSTSSGWRGYFGFCENPVGVART